jgi:hypothetical protein
MVNYQKSVLYNIWFEDQLLYSGSTTCFTKRKSEHNAAIKNNNTSLPFYRALYELNITFEELRFEIYKECPCNSIQELHKLEGELIRELKPKYNYRIAGRTYKEWRKDRYEKNEEVRKERYEKNKDVYLEKERIKYSERNKEKIECKCGSQVYPDGIKKHLNTDKHINFMNKNCEYKIIINK